LASPQGEKTATDAIAHAKGRSSLDELTSMKKREKSVKGSDAKLPPRGKKKDIVGTCMKKGRGGRHDHNTLSQRSPQPDHPYCLET